MSSLDSFVPCGIANRGVTSLSRLLGRTVELGEVGGRRRGTCAHRAEHEVAVGVLVADELHGVDAVPQHPQERGTHGVREGERRRRARRERASVLRHDGAHVRPPSPARQKRASRHLHDMATFTQARRASGQSPQVNGRGLGV